MTTVKFIQKKPSLNIDFFNADDDFKQTKLKYVSSNKMEDKGPVFSSDKLTKMWTLVFPDNETHLEFQSETSVINYRQKAKEYNDNNKISYSIEIE